MNSQVRTPEACFPPWKELHLFLARQRSTTRREPHVPIDGVLAFSLCMLAEPASQPASSPRLVIGPGQRSFSLRPVQSGCSSTTRCYTTDRFVPLATWQVTQPDTTLPPILADHFVRPSLEKGKTQGRRNVPPLLQSHWQSTHEDALLPGRKKSSSAASLPCCVALREASFF